MGSRPYRVRLAADQRCHAYSTHARALAAARADCAEAGWDERARVIVHHPTYGGVALPVTLVNPDGTTVVLHRLDQLRHTGTGAAHG